MKRITIALVIILFVLSLNTVAFAAGSETTKPSNPSIAGIVADVIFLRPLGFAATIAGCTAFIISLPIDLPMQKTELMHETLALKPAYFTFLRPFGEFRLDQSAHRASTPNKL